MKLNKKIEAPEFELRETIGVDLGYIPLMGIIAVIVVLLLVLIFG